MNGDRVCAAPLPDTGAPPIFVASYLVSCSLLWGSSFLFVKLLDGALSPLAIAACRGCVGGLVLALWFAVTGRNLIPRGRELRHWLVLGTLNGFVPNILVAYALLTLASGRAAMLQASGPLVTATLAHLAFADEKLGARRFTGLLIGLCGMVLLVGPRAMEGGASLLAVLAMLGVTLCYALGNIYTKTADDIEPARLALGQQVVSGLAALGLALAAGGWMSFVAVPAHLATLLALGVVATAVPITIFMQLIRRAGPTRAAMTGYLVPTFATLLGVAVLGERIAPVEALGGAVVLAGVFLVSTSRARAAKGAA